MESQKCNYDSLKVQGPFATSISEIGYANQQSEIQRFSNAPPKLNDRLPDYQIKINAPDIKYPDPLSNDKQQKTNHNHNQNQNQSQIQTVVNQSEGDPNEYMPRKNTTELDQKKTGYQNLRDSFSDQQIFKAFNILDINKDEAITEDDLIFVLDYIKEEYTQQEVKEMISMLSADKKHVTFEDFKKLGKGEIIPLAKYVLPDQKLKNQQKIFSNLSRTQLIDNNPHYLAECLKKDALSYSKFQQSKKETKAINAPTKIPTMIKDKLFMTVPLLEQSEFKKRKQLFTSIVISNIGDISRNYEQYRQKIINIQKVAMMLQISLRQAKQLYPHKSEVDSLLVIMEAIAYSQQKTIKRLDLCLEMVNNKSTLTVAELVHLLQIIKGKDSSIDKKIKAILVGNNLRLDEPVVKSMAHGLVLDYLGTLMF